MNEKCYGPFSRIRCNFEPRYDEKGGGRVNGLNGDTQFVAAVMRSMKDRIYVCDVCTACGEVRQRPSTDNGGKP